jgi:hypothetical protein
LGYRGWKWVLGNQGEETFPLQQHTSQFCVVLYDTVDHFDGVGNHPTVEAAIFDMNVVAKSPDDKSDLSTVSDSKGVGTEHIDLKLSGSGRNVETRVSGLLVAEIWGGHVRSDQSGVCNRHISVDVYDDWPRTILLRRYPKSRVGTGDGETSKSEHARTGVCNVVVLWCEVKSASVRQHNVAVSSRLQGGGRTVSGNSQVVVRVSGGRGR